MMRRISVLIGVFTLLIASAGLGWAAADSDTVTVTVNYVDLLDAPAATALTLTTATPGAQTYIQGTASQAGGLKYSHNSTAAKKITATAVKDAGNPANDITLVLTVTGGAGAATLVNAGADQANVMLWDSIAADGYTKDLSWTADGSLATTKAGNNANQNYIWTVTFTSADH